MPIATRVLTIAVDGTEDIYGENLAEIIHRAVPGSHTLENQLVSTDIIMAEWSNGEFISSPMNTQEAAEFIDDDGFITVITAIDQDRYMEFRAAGLSTIGADDEYDLLHSSLFDFGLPTDCTATILAVSGTDFIVSYTTWIDHKHFQEE